MFLLVSYSVKLTKDLYVRFINELSITKWKLTLFVNNETLIKRYCLGNKTLNLSFYIYSVIYLAIIHPFKVDTTIPQSNNRVLKCGRCFATHHLGMIWAMIQVGPMGIYIKLLDECSWLVSFNIIHTSSGYYRGF